MGLRRWELPLRREEGRRLAAEEPDGSMKLAVGFINLSAMLLVELEQLSGFGHVNHPAGRGKIHARTHRGNLSGARTVTGHQAFVAADTSSGRTIRGASDTKHKPPVTHVMTCAATEYNRKR